MLKSALGNAATAETRVAALAEHRAMAEGPQRGVLAARQPVAPGPRLPSSTQKCPQGNCTPATIDQANKDFRMLEVHKRYESFG
jgi:hypothetical protein